MIAMTEELKKYLLEQCKEWMLPEEVRALHRSGLTQHGEEVTRKSASIDFRMENRWGFSDEKTNLLVAMGKEGLATSIAERLLRDSGKEIVNNCPKCGGLARTPRAKQCRHCRHDWHSTKGTPRFTTES